MTEIAAAAMQRRQARQATILAGLAAIAPLIGVLAPHGEAPLMTVAAVLVLLCGGAGAVLSRIPRLPALLLALMVLWALASATWSPDPTKIALRTLQLAGLFAAGLYLVGSALALPAGLCRRVRQACLVGLGLAALVLIEEALSRGFLLRVTKPQFAASGVIAWWSYKPGIAMLAMLVWIAIADPVLRARPLAGWGAAAVVAALAAFIGGGTALVALVVAGAVYAMMLRGAGAALVIAVAVAILAAAAVVPWLAAMMLNQPAITNAIDSVATSATHRLIIWDFVTQRIVEHPAIGWGFDSSRSIPRGNTIIPGVGELLPLHPHNALLQWLLELGVPGLALGVAFVMWLVVHAGAGLPARHDGAAAKAMVIAATLFAIASFSIWQSWWLSALFIAAAIAAASLRAEAPAH